MKSDMVSDDARALRLVHKLRRRVKKKAAKLRAQRPADPAQSDREERARLAVKAVNRRLKDAISTLESRRTALSQLVEQLSRDDQLSA
jgi:hypothetical protein